MSQQHHVASNAQQELAIKPSINTLAQGSMFWQPDYRRASPWLEHTPFLFWLVEALQPRQCVGLGREGVAHLALCQAIGRLRLNAHCFLVAEGAALEKDGSKLSSIEKEAQEIASEQYPTTSHWLNTTPTRAIQQFDEESIDLLLLNVNADDDSVDYLLDRWLSRLSSQGVVLLPGIARRDPGCNVFRAFEALRARYPNFAFHHGDGLGVIAVGQQPTMLLHNLFSTVDSAASSRVVQDIFARLGRSCRDKLTTQEQRVMVQQLEDRLAVQQEQWQQAEAKQASLSNQLATSDSERSEMKKRLASQEERFAHERGRLAERVSSLEEFNHELKQELMRQRTQSEQRETERRERLHNSEQALAAVKEEQAKLAHELELKSLALEKAHVDIKQTMEERDTASHQVEALQAELAQAQQDASTRFEELTKLTRLLENSEQALEKAQADTKQAMEERDTASHQVEALQAELAQAQQDASTRFEELAKLTRLLENSEQALEKAQADTKQAMEERDTASHKVEALQTELAQAQQDASTRFEELAKLTTLLETNEQALAQEREAVAQLNTQLSQQQDALARPSQEAEALKRQLEQQRQEAKVFAEERFRELAILTELLEKKESDTQQEIDRQARELAALVALLEERGIDYSAAMLPVRREGRAGASTKNSTPFESDLALPLTAQPGIVKKAPPLNKRAIKRQVALLENSRYFEAQWYLAQYPDIARDAKMSADPARHYLLMGGFEGRNPGPDFDSAYYLATYEDVAQSEINPLIHYIKFGEKEQRSIKG